MTGYLLDEDWYLATYPDVATAVAAGMFASAAQHFAWHGKSEGRYPSGVAELDHLMGRGDYADDGHEVSEAERLARVGEVWSAEDPSSGWYWLQHPMVRARVNRLESGDPDQDTYSRLTQLLQQRRVSLPIGHAVSLGCGFGALERSLASRGIVHEIDAYDLAEGAIAAARRSAEQCGLGKLRYHVADLETVDLPEGVVDVVFAQSSVHHIERLDALFAKVSALLRPGGLFHVNEFVGPNRFQWTDRQIELVNDWLRRLPPRLRRLPNGQLRPLQGRATVAAMIAADPSEAVRSADIIPRLHAHFDIVDHRDLGGALLHLALSGIAQNFSEAVAEDRQMIEQLFAAEDAAMQAGEVGSDFVVITAAKRTLAGQ